MPENDKTGAERRRHVRSPLRMPAVLSGGRVKEVSCSVRDISWGGIFVEYESEGFEAAAEPAPGWKVGEAVDVGVTLPRQQRRFRVRGHVARADSGVFYNGLGIAIAEATSTFRVLMQELDKRTAPPG